MTDHQPADAASPRAHHTGLPGTAGPSSDTALLEVENLRTRFFTPRGTVPAVAGVSFTLRQGQTLGVVGESGSGKTVLSRSIMNLLPRRNLERTGSVRFDGQEILNLPDDRMRHIWGKDMARVFLEMGSSIEMIRRHYHHAQTDSAAEEWFSLTPEKVKRKLRAAS